MKEGREFEEGRTGGIGGGERGGNDINAVVVYEILKTPKH